SRGGTVPHEARGGARGGRRRSPPERAVTGRSCVSQPEKRKRPSRACARGRGSPGVAGGAFGRERGGRRIEDRAGRRKLERVLGEVPGHHTVAERDSAGSERMPAENRREERRL